MTTKLIATIAACSVALAVLLVLAGGGIAAGAFLYYEHNGETALDTACHCGDAPKGRWYLAPNGTLFSPAVDGIDRRGQRWQLLTNERHEYFYHRLDDRQPVTPWGEAPKEPVGNPIGDEPTKHGGGPSAGGQFVLWGGPREEGERPGRIHNTWGTGWECEAPK